jgi:hypothetical protein
MEEEVEALKVEERRRMRRPETALLLSTRSVRPDLDTLRAELPTDYLFWIPPLIWSTLQGWRV